MVRLIRSSDTPVGARDRAGYASGFQLHCSLQPGSGKMFVHAREADSPTNMRYMGLLVDKYVPDPAKAKGSSWEGARSCLTHMQTLIFSPIIRSQSSMVQVTWIILGQFGGIGV